MIATPYLSPAQLFWSVKLTEAVFRLRPRALRRLVQGGDAIELASLLHPFLTVAAQPARTFGTIAARFLIERIKAHEPIAPRKVVLPPQLIVRQSCGSTQVPRVVQAAVPGQD